MKIAIWVGVLFVVSAITTALKMNGILLGGIPTALIYGAAAFLASTLCKVWQNRRDEKEASKNKEAHEARQICKCCGAKIPVLSRACPQCGNLSDEIG